MSVSIQPGCRVKMVFSIVLEDGTIADACSKEDAFEFVIGQGALIDNLEQVLIGMHAAEKHKWNLEPEQAFGYHDPENIHEMLRSDFPNEMDIKPGHIIGFNTPSGEEIPGAIVHIDGDRIEVDFNHPIAGHRIEFEVEIIDVVCAKIIE